MSGNTVEVQEAKFIFAEGERKARYKRSWRENPYDPRDWRHIQWLKGWVSCENLRI